MYTPHCRERNNKVYNCFIDFKNASDLEWHEGLLTTMYYYWIVYKIIKLEDTQSVISINGKYSDWLITIVGNRQGDHCH